MRGFSTFLAVLAALCCAAFSAAEEAPPPQDEPASVDAEVGAASDGNTPARMCFGGYEDGKVIVRRVKDATAETTATACRIDGGSHARAPQSPILAARRFGVLV